MLSVLLDRLFFILYSNVSSKKERQRFSGARAGLTPEQRSGRYMQENNDMREQTLRRIKDYLPELTEKELRLVYAFIRGLRKGK